jgi:hypothetical protein
MPPTKKRPYDATFRFRGFKALGERIKRIAAARGYGDDSDILREGVMKHVMEQERALGIPKVAEDAQPYVAKPSKRKPRRNQK